MSEPLMYSLYVAKAVLRDFNDAYFPADPDDPAAQLQRNEELIEELDEYQWINEQIQKELKRIHKRARSAEDFGKLNKALAIADEPTTAEGYHRVAELYRRLTKLWDL
ncbi:hypothetical protein [Paraburkholderia adhaesiva]|uniref:hypothetical protein n=1 Tax=Paraburkholderia adhaesiva TaxID=2883244 RepID=UPI001F29F288|nr:hypothetical protein [Paraburkholderia adhaesiva]